MVDEQPARMSWKMILLSLGGAVTALISGLTGGMSWVANNAVKPVVERLVDNYDFQEKNAADNTAALKKLEAGIDALNKKYASGLQKQDETHVLLDRSIEVQTQTAEAVKKKAVP